MRNEEMLNRIYSAYNGYDVTYQEMLDNAKRFTDDVLRSYGYHLDEQEKYKYFAVFCAWVAASDGEVSRKEHEFFIKFSGLNLPYEEFRKVGLNAINNKDASEGLRDINKTFFRSGTTYDYATNIIALCICGCDGPLNAKEREFLNNYIRHPDYNPL